MRRLVLDSLAGTRGEFVGTATFAADDGGVVQTEAGELTYGDHRGPAERHLLWGPGSADGVQVRFADGRPFYVYRPVAGEWTAVHPCGADEYVVTGRWLGPHAFDEEWSVTGPTKSYRLLSSYRRHPSP